MTTFEKIAIIGGIVIVLGVGAYFVFKTPAKKSAPTGGSAPIAPPVASNASGFPLTPNMTGSLITNLQNGLNQYVDINPDIPVTGTFDSATATALATVGFNPLSVSQSDYNTIIAPPTAADNAASSSSTTTPQTSSDIVENFFTGWI